MKHMVIATCPCCGSVVDTDPLDAIQRRLTGSQLRIFRRLRSFETASMQDLIDAVYEDDPDGGPEWAEGCIRTHIHRLNAKAAPLGWRVKSSMGRGARYRLTREGAL